MEKDRIFKGKTTGGRWLTTIVFLLLTSLSLVITVTTAQAATYYVSTTGSDSNSGSSSAPFKTIQKAANVVLAGDTVYVRQGSYAGFAIANKNGTSSAWITFKPYPGEAVTINPYINNYATGYGRGAVIQGGSYIEINGFSFTDSNPLYDSASFSDYSQGVNREAIKVDSYSGVGASHVRIIGNHMHRIGFHGIYASYISSYCEIAGNLIEFVGLSKRGYGMYLGGSYHTVSGNTIHDAYGHGIQIYTEGGPLTSYNMIQDNIIYNNGSADYGAGYPAGSTPQGKVGCGIIVSAGSGSTSAGNGVMYNVLYNNINYGLSMTYTSSPSVYNNTTYGNGLQGLYISSSSATVRNNIAYGSLNQDGSSGNAYIGSGSIQDHNLFSTNPMFVNASGGDFHLQSGSSAIDTGVNVGLTYDMDNNPIVGTPDLGSYEYQRPPADTTAPSTPTGLTATAASSSQVNLSWTASTDNVGVTGYKVYRNGSLIATTTKTTCSDTGLAASTTYTYAVSAFDAAGNVSAQSASASATTMAPPDTTAPSAPAGLTATAVSSSQINLSWTASTDNIGVAGYKVYRNGIQIGTTTGTSYSNTGLAASTTYTYTVAAYDAAGNTSAQSASASATTMAPPDTTAPSVATGLTAIAASSSQINLSWTASTDNIGVAGYKVYRNGTQIGTTTGISYSNTGLAASTTYTYAVSAFDAAGNVSAQSASASATTMAPPDTTAPSVATGLTAIAASSSQINLSWTASTDNVGVAGYKVYRNGTQIGTTTGTSYSNTGLAASTTYTYTVAAYDAAGNTSAQSASASATTMAPPDTTAPSAPAGLTATAVSSSQINLSWTASTDNVGVKGYKVYRNGTQIGTTTGTSYSNTGLAASTTYTYTVAAYDAAGNTSAQSASASARTKRK